MVAHTLHPRTWEIDEADLYEFQATLGYIERPYLTK